MTDEIKAKPFIEALNKIAILGSSEKAYTKDFTNEVMAIVRKVLDGQEPKRCEHSGAELGK